MRGALRHTAVLVLGFALVTLVVACSGTQPLPDIEATVQARLNEERATEATMEARAQTMAKGAMVEATAQAAPTAIPVPPTPMSTATPTPTATPAAVSSTAPAWLAIMSFTQQALEIEAERRDLMAYFAALRGRVGIHGQAFAIERYLVEGVPPTLVGAPASGLRGMTSLRNSLLLLVSPEPMQPIKDALVHIYDSEI